MALRRPIFRKPALDKLATPEQFDDLMQVTTLRSWMILGAFGSVVVMILLWGFFGKVTDIVEAQGILTPLDVSTLEAAAYVPAHQIERIRIGMKAQVLPAEDAVYLQGEVISISSSPTRTADVPLYEVRIRLTRQVNRVYRSGEISHVRIIVDEVAPVQMLVGR
jgi:hypothetical protein